MKGLTILTLFIFSTITIYGSTPASESNELNTTIESQYDEILDEVLDVKENQFIGELAEKNKVIIIDEFFNKIREESIDDVENISSQSILVPTIYRSQFIAKVHNVSYYMLKKN